MGVKLQSALGGSVELNAPSTASNFAMTVPAGNGTVATTDQLLSFKNRIINGDFRFDQRMGGAAQTGVVAGTQYWLADRYRIGGDALTTGRFTFQRVAEAPTNFRFSGKITTTTAQTSLPSTSIQVLTHIIEGNNLLDLGWGTGSAKTVTISFWARASVTGTYDIAIRNDKSSSAMTYMATYTISTSNTWEYKTIVIPGPTSGTWYDDPTNLGIRLDFNLGSGTSYATSNTNQWLNADFFKSTSGVNLVSNAGATWQITGLQFEVGGSASPFEYRPFTTELALCQRYYEHIPNNTSIGVLNVNTAAQTVSFCIMWKVTKRSTPSVSIGYGAVQSASVDGATMYQGNIAGSSWYFPSGIYASAEL